jgi:hypothetical protein
MCNPAAAQIRFVIRVRRLLTAESFAVRQKFSDATEAEDTEDTEGTG